MWLGGVLCERVKVKTLGIFFVNVLEQSQYDLRRVPFITCAHRVVFTDSFSQFWHPQRINAKMATIKCPNVSPQKRPSFISLEHARL